MTKGYFPESHWNVSQIYGVYILSIPLRREERRRGLELTDVGNRGHLGTRDFGKRMEVDAANCFYQDVRRALGRLLISITPKSRTLNMPKLVAYQNRRNTGKLH